MKLLYHGADLLILDEPTAVLTPLEWKELSAVLRSLADEGKAIVFITHKLEEVFWIASRCTVLRDGRVVGTRDIADTSEPELALLMVGREVALRVVREPLEPGATVLDVRGLRVERGGRDVVSGVELVLRECEVLGVAGVDGNGQSELVEGLLGLSERSGGTVALEGEEISPGTSLADDPRVGHVPENRQRTGLALDLSVADNLMLKDFDRPPFARRGILNHRRARAHCEQLMREFDIRASDVDVPLRQLSGGNQQKVVLARELHREPRLLIAAQPTRGLDVGAMEFVYARMADFKRGGGATLLISTELEEILSLSDRVAVMVGGRFVRVLDVQDATLETLGMLMAGAGIEPEVAA
jgi:simple sugar transport system ATP-binding protein